MHEFLGHHGEEPDEERRQMSAETAERIMAHLDSATLADPERLHPLVERMGTSERMDGWTATKQLADSLGDNYDLYWGDLDLLRTCLGTEHAAAVFDGNEIDYRPLLGGHPEILRIARLTDLLQDSGKVLSVAMTGSNFAQSEYNTRVARNVVGCIADGYLDQSAKQAVVALAGLDVIGGILQGHDVDEKLAQFNAAWPAT